MGFFTPTIFGILHSNENPGEERCGLMSLFLFFEINLERAVLYLKCVLFSGLLPLKNLQGMVILIKERKQSWSSSYVDALFLEKTSNL